MNPWRLLAVDYDRTLTDESGSMHGRAAKAIHLARESGMLVVVCSGRSLAALRQLAPRVDAYVAENGAVTFLDRHAWTYGWDARPHVLRRLSDEGFDWEALDVILSLPRKHEFSLIQVLRGLDVRCVPNVDSVNLQPWDVDKGTGLARIQRAVGIPTTETVAIGDGENDVPLFRQAALALAVANCTSPARLAADRVLQLPRGEGVADFVERELLVS